jgi:nitrite reductase/ring-hydroxylating ferredoxin subunit
VKHVVAAAGEIPPGGRKIVELAGHSIGVFNIGGEFFALRNRCPHQGGPLCEGKLWGLLEAERPGEFRYYSSAEILACPWHGWEFHVRTGQSWCAPERLRARRYVVTVEDAAELVHDASAPRPGLVKGAYVVDTFPVSREGRYIVVSVPP